MPKTEAGRIAQSEARAEEDFIGSIKTKSRQNYPAAFVDECILKISEGRRGLF
jgi:hypothetical protein